MVVATLGEWRPRARVGSDFSFRDGRRTSSGVAPRLWSRSLAMADAFSSLVKPFATRPGVERIWTRRSACSAPPVPAFAVRRTRLVGSGALMSIESERAAAVSPTTEGRESLWRRADGALLFVALISGVAAMADLEAARFVAMLGTVSFSITVIRNRIQATRPTRADTATAAAAPEKQTEIEERALFLAMASHEIRTPLVGILGMADLLAATSLSPEQTAYLRAVRTSGLSLLDLVDGYLEMTRQDAGRGTLTPAPTSLEAIVEDVVELLAPPSEAKGLELASCVAPGLPARVMVDPVLLRQVLTNLAGNAVKYTEHGGVAIEVERGRDGIAFRVRDTGIGIDPADAERIFREFERIEHEGHDAPAGTGLGLAIASSIVARMGGEIRLESSPGIGSTFSFELVLPAIGAAQPAASPLAGLRVALLSDGEVEPPLLLRRLHALGAEALLVPSPEALIDQPSLDVVLIDHRPGFDAGAVLVRLRDLAIVQPQAVVLIAPTRRADLPRLRAEGFAGHLVKPVRAASLARVVAALAEAPPVDDLAATLLEIEDSRETSASGSAALGAALPVLLVDDNEINALLGRAVLEHLGHEVTHAADGVTALEAMAEARAAGRSFAAVLMDLHMPGLDGFSTIRALRAAEPAVGPRALVIAVTADATPAAAERARASGADAIMVKPIDRARLAELMVRARTGAPALDRSA